MTDAEVQTRVDAWIESRELSGDAAALADQWHDVSGRYGPQSPPAFGVLVALVGAGWGGSCIYTLELVRGGDVAAFSVRQSAARAPHACRYIAPRLTQGEALLAALEAAPQ